MAVTRSRARYLRPYQEAAEAARDAFLKAAAALTEFPTADVLAFALIEGGIGMLHVAKADESGAALAKAEAFLRGRTEARARGEEPCPEI